MAVKWFKSKNATIRDVDEYSKGNNVKEKTYERINVAFCLTQ